MNIKEAVKARKSVRTFAAKPLTDDDWESITQYLKDLSNPFGVNVEFRFLNAKEHSLSSPVIVGTEQYVAAKVKQCENFELAYGYSFESFCLYATGLGMGTVMLAGTLSRKAFEKAMQLKEDEVMPLASPIGYPAQKKSIREKMMRGATKADERLPFEKLFFENSFQAPLSAQNAGKFQSALEMLRLAPSAVNKQPWRVVVCGDSVHFFKKSAKLMSSDEFDLQKIDMGIALAHFDLTLKEEGTSGRFVKKEIDFAVDKSLEYIISYEV